jgi:hypothetical protein
MPGTQSTGASSRDPQTIDQLKSVVNAMAMIIQEHIPNANLSSVLSNMNVQVITCMNHYLFFYDYVFMYYCLFHLYVLGP